MKNNILKTQAFKLKGRLYTFTVLSMYDNDVENIDRQLVETIAQAPRLLDKAPVVLDFSSMTHTSLNLQELCLCLRNRGVVPVAVHGGDPRIEMLATAEGLAVVNSSSTHDKAIKTEVATPEAAPQIANTSKLITTPVRSGQQIVNKGGDLIIVGSVSPGSELLADGNIHIYGSLRGRALAGIAGDKSARIFCHSLNAELVSIAGVYRLNDKMDEINGPCQIFLQDERIQIETF